MDTVLNKADSGYKSLHHGLKKAMFTRRPSTELGGPWLQADPEVTALQWVNFSSRPSTHRRGLWLQVDAALEGYWLTVDLALEGYVYKSAQY
jgi:hypothetical protein